MLNKLVVIFDLDDTLYKEIDFLKSAYSTIAKELSAINEVKNSREALYEEMLVLYKNKKDVFKVILDKYKINKYKVSDLIIKYRAHKPAISLTNETIEILEFLKENNLDIGIITDGRSIQQRSKIEALGLLVYTNLIVISEEIGSEKPSIENYKYIEDYYANQNINYIYVGDNLSKDFLAPNKLGWNTVCLKDCEGINIHSQDITVENQYLPKYEIDTILKLKDIIHSLVI